MLTSLIKKAVKTVAMAGIAVGALTGAAFADYPEKPITLVIPFGPGGSHDLNARVMTSIIPQFLNQAMIVRLTPGAGGQKAMQDVSRAEPDGYTLIFSHNYIDMLQQYTDNLPYNPMEDFVPVARINYAPAAVIVRGDSEFETFEQLIEASRVAPGAVQMAHSGNWGAQFVPAALMMTTLDVTWNLVPYPGGGPALQALLAGDADFSIAFPSAIAAQLASGDVRVLATAGPTRIYEEVPTFAEVGIEGDVGFMHRMVLAPAGTPEDVLSTLTDAFLALADDPTFNSLMGRLGENVDVIDGPEYQLLREEQNEDYKTLVESITE
jgi:tripartite-type tricarboxylate transporter receptor subunit TctC